MHQAAVAQALQQALQEAGEKPEEGQAAAEGQQKGDEAGEAAAAAAAAAAPAAAAADASAGEQQQQAAAPMEVDQAAAPAAEQAAAARAAARAKAEEQAAAAAVTTTRAAGALIAAADKAPLQQVLVLVQQAANLPVDQQLLEVVSGRGPAAAPHAPLLPALPCPALPCPALPARLRLHPAPAWRRLLSPLRASPRGTHAQVSGSAKAAAEWERRVRPLLPVTDSGKVVPEEQRVDFCEVQQLLVEGVALPFQLESLQALQQVRGAPGLPGCQALGLGMMLMLMRLPAARDAAAQRVASC